MPPAVRPLPTDTKWDFDVLVPIRVTIQPEALVDYQDDAKRLYGKVNKATMRWVMKQAAQDLIQEALQIGASQYEGALIVVEARGNS